MKSIKETVCDEAVALLRRDGPKTHTDLKEHIQNKHPTLNSNSLNAYTSATHLTEHREIKQLDRGLFGYLEPAKHDETNYKHESAFYAPFSGWLEQKGFVKKSIAVGGKVFGDKFATPDVIGRNWYSRYELYKGETLTAGEVKTDVAKVMDSLSQVTAYELWAHFVWLVIPKQSRKNDLDRLEGLAKLQGFGLVLFDHDNSTSPDFQEITLPIQTRNDPHHANRYMKILMESSLYPGFFE